MLKEKKRRQKERKNEKKMLKEGFQAETKGHQTVTQSHMKKQRISVKVITQTNIKTNVAVFWFVTPLCASHMTDKTNIF